MGKKNHIKQGRYKKQPISFIATIEQRARRMVAQAMNQESHDSVQVFLAQNMALVLDQMDQIRLDDQSYRKQLLRLECRIDTQIMQLSDKHNHNSQNTHGERERLTNKLQKIEEDRWRLTLDRAARLQPLQERLLSLIQKQTHLSYCPPGENLLKDRHSEVNLSDIRPLKTDKKSSCRNKTVKHHSNHYGR